MSGKNIPANLSTTFFIRIVLTVEDEEDEFDIAAEEHLKALRRKVSQVICSSYEFIGKVKYVYKHFF